MFTSLPLFSLLFLALANLSAGQGYVSFTIDGTVVSFSNTFGGPAPTPTSKPDVPTTTPAPPVATSKSPPPVVPVPTQKTKTTKAAPEPTEAPHTHKPHKPSHKPHKPSHKPHKPSHKPHKPSQTRSIDHDTTKRPSSVTHKPQPQPSHKSSSNTSQSSQTHAHGAPSGQNVPNSGGQQTQPSSSSGSGSNKGLVIGLAVGITFGALLIAAIVGFFIYRRRKQRQDAPASSSFNDDVVPEMRSTQQFPAAQEPYVAPTREPTLPAVIARNSLADPFLAPEERAAGGPAPLTTSQPWAPKTPSRLSQIPETVATAEAPPTQRSIPRRPVGASSP